MARRMLIDATHPEESRVAIIEDKVLDDFDAESSTKRQFKGNIYLAKVIRVEPSLQAAFVEYGHNRHGFLPFSEIHPDYYRIPVGDRLSDDLIEEIPAEELVESVNVEEAESSEEKKESLSQDEMPEISEILPEAEKVVDPTVELTVDEQVELGDDEESVIRRKSRYRYKIQEVIKRRQILLVQVVKEERGNKGAALTTYLSLPGRYCVLMPNAGHRSGGISRKISDVSDRKRLKDILNDLPIPEGISLIVRTAGQDRNKLEIRRDFEYLIRLWGEIRDRTLTSIAPALVYAEGDLIKRSIRDNYDKEITEIVVDGEDRYKVAKAFMKTLIPSHAKKVKLYKDNIPLFQKYGVESQIDAIMSPVAVLPSGGSIVISPTEALVAIDVNSGKSTRERHIDDTALRTNLEAAGEVARQMRLRDLAGLIVIDFIDMSDPKSIAAVEKKLRESVRQDRARIQIGKISQFGLMELSRQRLRPSLIESHMRSCTHCHGTGLVRSIESMALLVLRAIETAGLSGKSDEIVVTVPSGVDLYLLNQKRTHVILLEQRYSMAVTIQRDDSLVPPEFKVDTLVEREGGLKEDSEERKNKPAEKIDESLKDSDDEKPSEISSAEPRERDRSQQRQRRNPFQNRRRKEQRQDSTVDQSQEKVESAPKVDEIKEGVEKVDGDRDKNRRRNRRRGRGDRNRRESQDLDVKVEEKVDSQDAPVTESEPKKEVEQKKRRRKRPTSKSSVKSIIEAELEVKPVQSGDESKESMKSKEKPQGEKKVVPLKDEKESKGDKEKKKPEMPQFFPKQTLLDPTKLMFNEDKPQKKKKKGFWSRLLEV